MSKSLYDIYEELLRLGFIKPMLIRQYNDEYVLVHIFSDGDVDVCKIVKSANDTFTILITNFKKDSVDCYEGDPISFITDRFIEANGLDKPDVKILADVANLICPGIGGTFIDDTYIIQCNSFRIVIKVKDDVFELLFYNDEYTSSKYRFKNGFEVFKFIYYIRINGVKDISFNTTTLPLVELLISLYLEFGNDTNNIISIFPAETIEGTIIKLQSKNGYMIFSIAPDSKNYIECKIDKYNNKFFGNFKARKYEDILDFAIREYEVIK
jgi:hypothetical protein